MIKLTYDILKNIFYCIVYDFYLFGGLSGRVGCTFHKVTK